MPEPPVHGTRLRRVSGQVSTAVVLETCLSGPIGQVPHLRIHSHMQKDRTVRTAHRTSDADQRASALLDTVILIAF